MRKKIFSIMLVMLTALMCVMFVSCKAKDPKSYTVIFDFADGDSVASQTVVENRKVQKPQDPIKQGYIFLYWYLDDPSVEFDFTTYQVTSNITLTAKWQEILIFTATFDTAGGGVIEDQTIDKYAQVQKPQDPIKDGYIFRYWYLDDQNVEFDFTTYQVTSDITLTALWEEFVSYTVTFDTVDGGVIESQTIVKYSQVQKPQDPIREEFIFLYWYLDDPKVEFDFETYQVKNDITLTALWEAEEKYTVTFDSVGGTPVASQIVYKYDYVQAPQDPIKEGETFLYWYLDFKTINFDFENYLIESDVTLTARYASDVVKYTVSFDSVGGTPVASQEVEDYKLVQVPKNPTKEGDTFLYWYLGEQNKVFDFETRPEGNITLTACWESDATLYTIYYKIGDELYQRQEIGRDGYFAEKPENPTKDGYVFLYWYLEDTNKDPFDFSSTEITKTITLKAYFVSGELTDGQIKFSYGILTGNSFVSGMNSKQQKITANAGDTISLLRLYMPYGYDFLGWVNATTGEKYLVEDYPNLADYKFTYDGKPLVMYAIWG